MAGLDTIMNICLKPFLQAVSAIGNLVLLYAVKRVFVATKGSLGVFIFVNGANGETGVDLYQL